MIGRALNTKQIAARLGVAVKTVETQRENSKARLGLTNGLELARYAVIWTHQWLLRQDG